MEIIQQFISEDIIYALGWTVMHSLWQAFAIAIILAFVLHVFRNRSASIRYEASTFALFLVLVSAVCTFIWHYDAANESVAFVSQKVLANDVIVAASEADALSSFTQTCIAYFNTHLPIIVMIWLVGVAFFVLRLVGGLVYVQRLKYYRTRPLAREWEQRLQRLSRKIPVKKSIKIVESAAVKVPMVIGYFKPFILLPIGAINQLEAAEVEAVIAHEVAHVYRNDFMMNIFISFVEVFFYYNPAVWWISGNIRLERENCCDDIAIQVCGNSLSYAKTLVRLQELNAYTPSFAMPFSGRRNQLLHRIQRILHQPQNRHNILERLTATVFLLFAVIFMSVHQNTVELETGNTPAETSSISVGEVPLEAGMRSANKKVEIIKVRKFAENKRALSSEVEGEAEVEHHKVKVVKARVDDRFIAEAIAPLQANDAARIIVGGLQQFQKKDNYSPLNFTVSVLRDTIPEKEKERRDIFFHGSSPQKHQYITKVKNADGQTVIVIAAGDDENIEIIVDEDADEILINGDALVYGDTLIVEERGKGYAGAYLFGGDGHALFDARSEEMAKARSNYWKDADRAYGSNLFLRDSLRGEAEYLMDELRARQEFLRKDEKRELLWQSEKELELLHDKAHELRLQEEKALFEKQSAIEREKDRIIELRQGDAWEEMHSAKAYTNVPTMIGRQLKADGLIKDEQNFRFSLSHERLKVNGKKQSKALHDKYLKLHRELTGESLDKDSKYEITLSKN